jgi:hypothetical protein
MTSCLSNASRCVSAFALGLVVILFWGCGGGNSGGGGGGSTTPTISSLSPTSGAAGTAVTISGTNFGSSQGTSTVTFNSTAATPTSWSSSSIVVSVPTGATTGNVVVTVGGTASNGVKFTVSTPAPTISSLSPTSGPVGTPVTITGTNFGATQGSSTVTFNGTAATPTSWSATSVVANVPTGASTGNVVVTVGGTASNGVSFTVSGPAPTISSLSPTSGGVGTAVTITGTNFGATQGSSTVTFNGTAAIATSWSATSIAVTVPIGATTGNVVVTVGGTASSGVNFTVTPDITSLSPTSGAVGTPVTITGTAFGSTQGSSTVMFNGTAATPTSWSATSIVVPVPTGASSGNVVVTVGGAASNPVSFTVLPPPAITSLSATSGAPGLAVTITGTNFGATQGSSTVTFNGTSAGTASSWSQTSITVNVPSGATTGSVVVTVSGVASNGENFTVVTGKFALVQTLQTTTSTCPSGTGAGTSCTLTLSQPTSAGDLGVVTVALLSFGPVYVTSVTDSKSSTWTVPGNTGSGGCALDSGNYGSTGCGYNLSLPGGVTSVTVNWSASVPEGAEFDFREYSYNGGAIALDNIATNTGTSSVTDSSGNATFPGVVPGITGTNDVIVTAFSLGSSQPNAITAPYTDTNFNVPYYGSADVVNSTDNSAPTITICCAQATFGVFAISFKPDPPAGQQAATITPARSAVTVTQPVKLTAAIAKDESGAGVVWSSSSGGKLTEQSGTSASFSATAPGVYTVKATSAADSSKTATATVAVTDLQGVYTYRYDVSRDGANNKEYALTESNVTKARFGKLFSCAVDGAIYGQPLWAANLEAGGQKRNVVFVTTERGSVYAFDADASSCAQLWHANVGDGGAASTTWIDPSTNTLYVVTRSGDSTDISAHQQVRALDVLSGNEKSAGLVGIDGESQDDSVLIDLTENGSTPAHLMVTTRTDGFAYVLNRASLAAQGDGNVLQRLELANPVWATASYWNNKLYIAGDQSPLYLYQFDRSSSRFSPLGQSAQVIGYPRATTAVSASGTGNGIVWALETGADCVDNTQSCGPTILHAYDAANLGSELWNSSMAGTDALGNVLHPSVPTVANGKVYVGTGDNDGGKLVVYGLKAN